MVTVVYCAVETAMILYGINAAIGLRVDRSEEEEGLDIALHGESVQ